MDSIVDSRKTPSAPFYVAFAGTRLVAKGPLAKVAAVVKARLDAQAEPGREVLILDSVTSRPIEINFAGGVQEVLANLPNPGATARLAPELGEPSAAPAVTPLTGAPTGRPGRPHLGVVPREVTLLPRHWEWLAAQPGGASVTLRKLVEAARKEGRGAEQDRLAVESADRLMRDVAGDLPGYEEASRALYRRDRERFEAEVSPWPEGLRMHLLELLGQLQWA